MSYLQPLNRIEHQSEVKRSRFIALLVPVTSTEQVKAALTEIRRSYKGANHYCSAWLLGGAAGISARGKSDDGEPAGTAGQPMLALLEHKNLVNVLAVVVRYFGGIKLGAGGLVRAYSGAVNLALEQLQTQPLLQLFHYSLSCDYEEQRQIEHLLLTEEFVISQREFTATVLLQFQGEREIPNELKQKLCLNGAQFA